MPSDRPKPYYVATPKEQAARTAVYKNLETMRQLKDKPMPHFTDEFGPMSWNQYIDLSERYMNGYTLSRDAQGKEPWQSNLLDNATRTKVKAIAAAIGLKVPESAYSAKDKNGVQSNYRAEIFKNIVKQSFKDGNPTLRNFFEVWQVLSHGTVFTYEGYRTGGAMQDVVESFDSLTGEVKTKRQYRKMDGKPFSVLLSPQEFFWWDMRVEDVQDQARVALVQHYNRRELELEFSKFPNYKYVKDKQTVKQSVLTDTLFYTQWGDRVTDENDFEVVRMFSKVDDGADAECMGYEVWVNGVPMLRAPLLWGDKEKIYPFAKQIAEPFANTNFFVGMSLPGILANYSNAKNTVLNTLIDKLYRSVSAPMLVGLGNKDLLDVESGIVSQDNRIYVPDVTQVTPMPIQGVNQGELAMLQILDRGIESASVDRTQQGVNAGVQKTARQSVIEDQRAQELKSTYYMALENLWYQKTKLRNEIVLTHYLKDKAAAETKRDQIITIKDYTFGDGARGILDIHVAKTAAKLMPLAEVEAREQAAEQQGIAYKLISITQDYLNDFVYDFEIVTESFHKRDKLAEEEELKGELTLITTLFPNFFVANTDYYLKEVLEHYGHHIDEFNPPANPAAMGMGGQPGAEQGAPQDGQQPAQPQPLPQMQPQQQSVLGLQ